MIIRITKYSRDSCSYHYISFLHTCRLPLPPAPLLLSFRFHLRGNIKMFSFTLTTLLLLPAALRVAVAAPTNNSSTACNNTPDLCDRAYNNITHLGAHDSPFVRDAANDYDISGNQYYNSTVQLAAGVRLLTAQVQTNTSTNALHVCHTSCDLFDAGTLSSWLSEVNTCKSKR